MGCTILSDPQPANSEPLPEAFCRGSATDVAIDSELLCPACGYNLQGLTSRQCPECGSSFDPMLLRNALRARGHPWLFEHGPLPSPLRFVRTLARSLPLSPVWRRIDPAHIVRVSRLALYACLSGPVAFALFVTTRAAEQQFLRIEDHWLTPTPMDVAFTAGQRFWPVVIWIPASLVSLAVVSGTLRRASIRKAQLFRLIVYSADVLWLLPCAASACRLVAYYERRVRYTYLAGGSGVWEVPPRILILTDLTLLALTLIGLTLRLAISSKLYLHTTRLWLDIVLSQCVAIAVTLAVLTLTTNSVYELFVNFR